ncbi:MAG: type II secretion system F family protein [Phycisphaerales bacterium]
MPTYSYNARDEAGQSATGTLEAKNQHEAIKCLQRDGLVVTGIRIGGAGVDAATIRLRNASKYVKKHEVIGLSQQLSVMLETGVPLSEALTAFVDQSKAGPFKKVISVVAQRINSGMPFSDAMREFPHVFPNLMVSLMQASEASGTMGLMLRRISEYLEKDRKTAKQIKGALTYPMIMVSIASVVTVFLVVYVLPRFAKIYESKEAALPASTQFVINTSRFISANWMLLIVAIAAIVVGAFTFRAMPFGRRLIDRAKLKLPIIGPVFTNFYLTRATSTLGTLLASGVALLDAIRIVKGVTKNAMWEQLWEDTEHALTTGRTLSEVVVNSLLVPPSVAQMINAGEKTGKLPEVFDKISESSESDLDNSIKNSTQYIEPAMIVFMGVTIGGLAISLLLPIFNVATVMSGGD